MDTPQRNANAKIAAAPQRVSRDGCKDLVTELVCWATGG
jgi:hypothetical protein